MYFVYVGLRLSFFMLRKPTSQTPETPESAQPVAQTNLRVGTDTARE